MNEWSCRASVLALCGLFLSFSETGSSYLVQNPVPSTADPIREELDSILEERFTWDRADYWRTCAGMTFCSTELTEVSAPRLPAAMPESFSRFVERGAEAIPILLERLADGELSGVTLDFGGAVTVAKLLVVHGNGDNLIEKERLGDSLFEQRPKLPADWGGSSGTVVRLTKGELCSILLGQICNRNYHPYIFVPSRIAVHCSGSVFPEVVEYMTAIWGNVNGVGLRESLYADLQTKRASTRGWFAAGALARLYEYGDRSWRTQSGMALRLLATGQADAFMAVYGAPPTSALLAISGRGRSSATADLVFIVENCENLDLVSCAIGPAVLEADSTKNQLAERLVQAQEQEYTSAIRALRRVAAYDKEVLRSYCESDALDESPDSVIACIGMADVVFPQESWPKSYAHSKLGDTREGRRFGVRNRGGRKAAWWRVCDSAAEVFCRRSGIEWDSNWAVSRRTEVIQSIR